MTPQTYSPQISPASTPTRHAPRPAGLAPQPIGYPACPHCGRTDFRAAQHRENHVRKHVFEAEVETARAVMAAPTKRAAWVEEIDSPLYPKTSAAVPA